MKHTLWGSAFTKNPSSEVLSFTAGRDVKSLPACDEALIPYDIMVNKVHCSMLEKQSIISHEDAQKLLTALSDLEALWRKGEFLLDPEKEDVHTNIENWLTEKLGIEIAGKIHTARSRNDQVATDMKLYTKEMAQVFIDELSSLVDSLQKLSITHSKTIMPGFTHHQHAMVTTYGELLKSFSVMLQRDCQKFSAWNEIHDESPLGSMAGYGTSFPIDKKYTASELGFNSAFKSSIDTVTNRGESETDLAYSIVSMMNHFSHIAQTFIILSTPQFGFIRLADNFSTGSSVMPQKKNPDPLEVIKAKAAYASGQLQSLIAIGQANFLGYNRDSQWSKYIIMDLIRECVPTPQILQELIESTETHAEQMEQWCHRNFIGATTLMEQLCKSYKIPMRVAKIIVEKAIKNSENKHKIDYNTLINACNEQHISCPVTKEEVMKWQDPHWLSDLKTT